MKDQLYFHERKDDDNCILDHTYCVEFKDEVLYVGYSITHPSDTFCKKTGRENAKKKLLALEGIPLSAYTNTELEDDIGMFLPHSIDCTLFDTIERAKELLKLQNVVDVKLFTFQGKRKVPTTVLVY